MADRLLLLLAVIGVLGACPKGAAPAPSAEPARASCGDARAALDAHLALAPRDCKIDSECRALYLRADACAPPIVAAARYSADGDQKLLALQKTVLEICPMAKRACEAVQANPACRLNLCVDDRGPSGVAQRECSPADGPAWTFAFTEGQEARCDNSAFPVVTATIWSAVKAGDRFTLDPAKKSAGVLMRCQTAKECVTGTGSTHISGMHEGGWVVEIDALFEGTAVRQSFLARTCPGEPRCD